MGRNLHERVEKQSGAVLNRQQKEVLHYSTKHWKGLLKDAGAIGIATCTNMGL